MSFRAFFRGLHLSRSPSMAIPCYGHLPRLVYLSRSLPHGWRSRKLLLCPHFPFARIGSRRAEICFMKGRRWNSVGSGHCSAVDRIAYLLCWGWRGRSEAEPREFGNRRFLRRDPGRIWWRAPTRQWRDCAAPRNVGPLCTCIRQRSKYARHGGVSM